MNCGFFFYQSVTWRDVVPIPLLFVNHIDFNWSFMTLFITEMSRWRIWWIFKVRGRKDPVLQIQKIYLSQPLLKINVTLLILILSFFFRRLCDGDFLISSLIWHPCCRGDYYILAKLKVPQCSWTVTLRKKNFYTQNQSQRVSVTIVHWYLIILKCFAGRFLS